MVESKPVSTLFAGFAHSLIFECFWGLMSIMRRLGNGSAAFWQWKRFCGVFFYLERIVGIYLGFSSL